MREEERNIGECDAILITRIFGDKFGEEKEKLEELRKGGKSTPFSPIFYPHQIVRNRRKKKRKSRYQKKKKKKRDQKKKKSIEDRRRTKRIASTRSAHTLLVLVNYARPVSPVNRRSFITPRHK